MRISITKARQHFLATDPIMANLLALLDEHEIKLSIPKPVPSDAYGTYLVQSIISQQLSTKAAATITNRVRTILGTLEPRALAALPDAPLKEAGLSAQKIRYIRALAETLPHLTGSQFATESNTAIIDRLTTVPGIGVWTAEMFLIFALARSNVFTLRDLGLRDSLHYYYRLSPTHHKKRDRIIAAWQKHATMASLVLWKARDTGLPRS